LAITNGIAAAVSTVRSVVAEADIRQDDAGGGVPVQATAYKQSAAGTHAAAAVSIRAAAPITALGEAVGEGQVLDRDVTAVGKEDAVMASPADRDLVRTAVDGDTAVEQRQFGAKHDR
jgi:hypothetical protein